MALPMYIYTIQENSNLLCTSYCESQVVKWTPTNKKQKSEQPSPQNATTSTQIWNSQLWCWHKYIELEDKYIPGCFYFLFYSFIFFPLFFFFPQDVINWKKEKKRRKVSLVVQSNNEMYSGLERTNNKRKHYVVME